MRCEAARRQLSAAAARPTPTVPIPTPPQASRKREAEEGSKQAHRAARPVANKVQPRSKAAGRQRQRVHAGAGAGAAGAVHRQRGRAAARVAGRGLAAAGHQKGQQIIGVSAIHACHLRRQPGCKLSGGRGAGSARTAGSRRGRGGVRQQAPAAVGLGQGFGLLAGSRGGGGRRRRRRIDGISLGLSSLSRRRGISGGGGGRGCLLPGRCCCGSLGPGLDQGIVHRQGGRPGGAAGAQGGGVVGGHVCQKRGLLFAPANAAAARAAGGLLLAACRLCPGASAATGRSASPPAGKRAGKRAHPSSAGGEGGWPSSSTGKGRGQRMTEEALRSGSDTCGRKEGRRQAGQRSCCGQPAASGERQQGDAAGTACEGTAATRRHLRHSARRESRAFRSL